MAKCIECGRWIEPGHECSKGAEVLRAERDEARQVARRCLAWLDEALLVNNPARWYDRYPWLRGPADALPAPVPPAGEQHEHQHDPGGGEQQHTL